VSHRLCGDSPLRPRVTVTHRGKYLFLRLMDKKYLSKEEALQKKLKECISKYAVKDADERVAKEILKAMDQ